MAKRTKPAAKRRPTVTKLPKVAAGELLTLSGEVRRAQIDEPVCPVGAGVG